MVKPIETLYNGYRFRSRLEARWAVFFDNAGLRYVYEPEGFDLDGVRYLPDFWLLHPIEDFAEEGWGFWAEIKPFYPTPDELNKFRRLCEATKRNGLLFVGQPRMDTAKIIKVSAVHFQPSEIWHMAFVSDDLFTGLEGQNTYGRKVSSYPLIEPGRAIHAFEAATQARFEFDRR